MKLNIRLKMLAGFMAVVVLLVAVSVVSYVNFNSLADSAGGIKQSASLDDAVMSMQIGLLEGMDVESRVLISGYEQGMDREFQDTVDAFDEGEGTIEEFGAAEQRVLLREMAGDHDNFQAAVLGTVALAREGNLEEAAANSIEVTDPVITELLGNLTDLEEEVESFGDAALASADSAKSSATMIVIVLAIVSVVVSMAIALYLSTTISNAVQKVGRALADLAERVLPGVAQVTKGLALGDVNQTANVQVDRVDVKSSDEVGQMTVSFNDMVEQLNTMGGDLNDMVGNLQSLIGQVTDSANSLGEASGQLSSAAEQAGQATQGIATASQQVAKGAQEQSARSQEVTGGMGQLSRAIDQVAVGSQEQAGSVEQASSIVAQVSKATADVAKSAQAAADGSRQANEAAGSGRDVVEKTVAGMERIKGAVDTV